MSDSVAVTAVAHPNIALIKYWGKRDNTLNLPDAGSVSITLDSLTTTSTFSTADADTAVVRINDQPDSAAALKVQRCIDQIRQFGDPAAAQHARSGFLLESYNNFPTAAGLASSASGFAALVTAADGLLGTHLADRQLSVIARMGSGSAARSLFGGFVRMHRGERADGSDAHAEQHAPPSHWPLSVVIAVTSQDRKHVNSTDGMGRSKMTSPYHDAWIETTEADIDHCLRAIDQRDFEQLAQLSEHSCLKMHASMMATRPPLLYWNPTTLAVIQEIMALRRSGVGVFFTVDAGPQVKAICLPEDAEQVSQHLSGMDGVLSVQRTGLGAGARLTTDSSPS